MDDAGWEECKSSEEAMEGDRKETSPLRLATRYLTQSLASLLMSLLVLKHDVIVSKTLHCSIAFDIK